jgi:hypothetical protein
LQPQSPPPQKEPPLQTTPHAPQFVMLESVFTQTPLQSDSPAGHWHPPAWQDVPPVHTFPQALQFVALVFKSAHVPLQSL